MHEVLIIHSALVNETCPSDRCLVCDAALNDHGHTRGIVCDLECLTISQDVARAFNRRNQNIAAQLHDAEKRAERKRWKGLQ